jgi:hypothetical protein
MGINNLENYAWDLPSPLKEKCFKYIQRYQYLICHARAVYIFIIQEAPQANTVSTIIGIIWNQFLFRIEQNERPVFNRYYEISVQRPVSCAELYHSYRQRERSTCWQQRQVSAPLLPGGLFLGRVMQMRR